MLFGSHVSIAGGIENAPINASQIRAEVFQMFSRSPRGGNPIYTEQTIKQFKQNCRYLGFTEFYIHTPYYINLASRDNKIRHSSIKAIRDELDIGAKLGAKYVMTHLGSAKDFPQKKALELVIKGINAILDSYTGTTELLIENSAGSGQIIGDKFEEIGFILKKIKSKKVGVCLDTCHAFASGYDLRAKTALTKTLELFDKHIGLKKLKLFHFNDSITELNARRDRHEDVGQGAIGLNAFALIIQHPKLKHFNAITETPALKISDAKTMSILKTLRE